MRSPLWSCGSVPGSHGASRQVWKGGGGGESRVTEPQSCPLQPAHCAKLSSTSAGGMTIWAALDTDQSRSVTGGWRRKREERKGGQAEFHSQEEHCYTDT